MPWRAHDFLSYKAENTPHAAAISRNIGSNVVVTAVCVRFLRTLTNSRETLFHKVAGKELEAGLLPPEQHRGEAEAAAQRDGRHGALDG